MKRVDIVLVLATLVILGAPGGWVHRTAVNFLATRSERTAVVRYWEQLTSEGGRRGAEETSVTVVEFFDYECPGCRAAAGLIDSLGLPDEKVSIVYRHYPLMRIHRNAHGAALASVCAEEQGRFLEMHRVLLSSQLPREPDWRELGRSAGVAHLDEFARCLVSTQASIRIARDIALADSLGVVQTPTWVSREHGVSGRWEDFLAVVSAR